VSLTRGGGIGRGIDPGRPRSGSARRHLPRASVPATAVASAAKTSRQRTPGSPAGYPGGRFPPQAVRSPAPLRLGQGLRSDYGPAALVASARHEAAGWIAAAGREATNAPVRIRLVSELKDPYEVYGTSVARREGGWTAVMSSSRRGLTPAREARSRRPREHRHGTEMGTRLGPGRLEPPPRDTAPLARGRFRQAESLSGSRRRHGQTPFVEPR